MLKLSVLRQSKKLEKKTDCDEGSPCPVVSLLLLCLASTALQLQSAAIADVVSRRENNTHQTYA